MRHTTFDSSRRTNTLLWIAQILLALIFLFAGAMKFIMPMAEMTKTIPFPPWFLHGLGGVEILGGLGVVLPWLTGIRPILTPLAALGLVPIMIGATVVTIATGQAATAVVPFVVGLLAVAVARGRSRDWRDARAMRRRGLTVA